MERRNMKILSSLLVFILFGILYQCKGPIDLDVEKLTNELDSIYLLDQKYRNHLTLQAKSMDGIP